LAKERKGKEAKKRLHAIIYRAGAAVALYTLLDYRMMRFFVRWAMVFGRQTLRIGSSASKKDRDEKLKPAVGHGRKEDTFWNRKELPIDVVILIL